MQVATPFVESFAELILTLTVSETVQVGVSISSIAEIGQLRALWPSLEDTTYFCWSPGDGSIWSAVADVGETELIETGKHCWLGTAQPDRTPDMIIPANKVIKTRRISMKRL
jgi:hypothetical protein